MRSTISRWLSAVAVPLAVAVPAGAQDFVDPLAGAPVEWRALALTPVVSASPLWLDTNVRRDAEDPVTDYYSSVLGGLEIGTRAGELRVMADGQVRVNHYQQERELGSIDFAQSVSVERPFWRIRPRVTVGFDRNRAPWNIETDLRARHRTAQIDVGLDIRLSGRTTLSLDASRRGTKFNDAEAFDGVNLASTLDRTTVAGLVSLRYALTPATNLLATYEQGREVFDTALGRNSRDKALSVGLELAPTAVIQGVATFGFRDVVHAAFGGDARRESGALVAIRTTAWESRQLDLGFAREVNPSYDPTRPYFVDTRLTAGFSQRLGAQWEVRFALNDHSLDYADPGGILPAEPDRVDNVSTAVTCDLAVGIELGGRLVYQTRRSPDPARGWSGLQVGTTAAVLF